MIRFIDDDERRARLGLRHRLAAGAHASSALEVARSLTAIHGTDPGSTFLGIIARSADSTIADIESAFYDDRTIIRLLGMRRTIFAVDYQLAPSVWASSESTVIRNERRLLARMLESSGITDIEQWIVEATQRFLSYLDAHPGSTSTEIAAADPYLGHRLPLNGPGATATSQSVASRLLVLTSAEGRVIRARPKGAWTSTQCTWCTRQHWRSDWPASPTPAAADVAIVRSWLYGHGPAAVDDLAWWTGWPKGRSRLAIDGARGIEVRTSQGVAFVLESDIEPVSASEPWVALLPGLDSSTMGWKGRAFYLGPHTNRLFDNVGNAGPTVWVSGKIVGGWVQCDDGSVAIKLFEDVGAEAQLAIAEKSAMLEQIVESVRLRPRARRWTESEIELRRG